MNLDCPTAGRDLNDRAAHFADLSRAEAPVDFSLDDWRLSGGQVRESALEISLAVFDVSEAAVQHHAGLTSGASRLRLAASNGTTGNAAARSGRPDSCAFSESRPFRRSPTKYSTVSHARIDCCRSASGHREVTDAPPRSLGHEQLRDDERQVERVFRDRVVRDRRPLLLVREDEHRRTETLQAPDGGQERDRGREIVERGVVSDRLPRARTRVDANDLELHSVRRVHERVVGVVRVELHLEQLFDLDVRGRCREEPNVGRALVGLPMVRQEKKGN